LKKYRPALLVLGVICLIAFATTWLMQMMTKEDIPTYTKVLSYFYNDEVQSYKLDFNNNKLDIILNDKDKTTITYTVPSAALFLQDTETYRQEALKLYAESADKKNVIGEYDFVPAKEPSLLASMWPYLVLMVAMMAFYFYMMRQQGGGNKLMNFGKARYKTSMDDKRRVTFDDVAGLDEEKEELSEVVEFLRNPQRFSALGARVPKGVLLVGPPGTGKTLMARAVAGEAGVHFFSVSGSDFVEMYVGMGASRVRDLFEQAKKNLPCIIFVDEIDAVGRRRGAGLGGGHDEREQTLNQILVEMDGFGVNEGVVIIAATNRPDVLDPALLRAGRFDRLIVVSPPDAKGREAVLRVHAKNKPLGPDVNLGNIAKTTVGFTPADLENVLNEAALIAAKKKKKAITNSDIEDAKNKVMMGPEKRSRKVTERDKMITAYHEAGHAVASYFLPTQDPVHEISIIPRGMAGGYTMYLPKEDKSFVTRDELMEDVVSLMGGRVAESLMLDDISTGASNDIQRATQIARKMITKYGFSENLGAVCLEPGDGEVFLGRDFMQTRTFSEKIAAEVDTEVKNVIDKAYGKALTILEANKKQLEEISAFLLANEKMNGEDFTRLMDAATGKEHIEPKKDEDIPQ